MRNKVFLAIGLALAALVALLVFLKAVETSRSRALPPADTVKKEDASKNEAELFSAASRYVQSGDLLPARDAYREIIERFPGSNNIKKAKEALEDINVRILFSPIPTPDSVSYEVKKGDTLSKIAKKFSNTQEMVLKAGNIRDPKIVPLGKKLKIHKGKFSIVIDKSQNTLTLKSDDKIIKTYRVSTGLNNSTPVGNFKIINKIVDPPWYTAGAVIPANDPRNILGSRWMGISAASYGIHGTTEPQSIGKQVTSGCVRMKNSDVEELYRIVPEGTEVIIVD